jgi:rhodanese-related sulfurtransferase
MTKFFKILAAAMIALFAIVSLSSCSSVEAIDMSKVEAVVDVRTSGEFSTGHLEGALNIDIQGSDFATQIDALDHSSNFVIYCHSGNRAGQAVSYMHDHGFTGTLTNAGGVDDASSATGLPIVQ